jgi:hypothetical protein
MRNLFIGAAALALATTAAPASAQDSSYKIGDMWTAARIDVEDGQLENYMDYVTGEWMAVQDYRKAQGWISGYHILQSINSRTGEPDLILITQHADMPSAAEAERRDALIEKRMNQTDRSAEAASGQRSKMRELMGSVLYRELLKR